MKLDDARSLARSISSGAAMIEAIEVSLSRPISVVADRRQDDADRLRGHHVAHRLAPASGPASARPRAGRGRGLDPGAEDLAPAPPPWSPRPITAAVKELRLQPGASRPAGRSRSGTGSPAPACRGRPRCRRWRASARGAGGDSRSERHDDAAERPPATKDTPPSAAASARRPRASAAPSRGSLSQISCRGTDHRRAAPARLRCSRAARWTSGMLIAEIDRSDQQVDLHAEIGLHDEVAGAEHDLRRRHGSRPARCP